MLLWPYLTELLSKLLGIEPERQLVEYALLQVNVVQATRPNVVPRSTIISQASALRVVGRQRFGHLELVVDEADWLLDCIRNETRVRVPVLARNVGLDRWRDVVKVDAGEEAAHE